MAGGVLTIGETLGLVHSASGGSLVHSSSVGIGIAGAESAVAIGLVRLGAAATWVGRVGDDSLGLRIIRELRGEGVQVLADVDRDAATGIVLTERRPGAPTAERHYRAGSAASRLTTEQLAGLPIEHAGILHVSGASLALSASARDAVIHAVHRATAAGVPVSFHVNHCARLWADASTAAQAYRYLARFATIVFAGLDEARMLASAANPDEMVTEIAHLGPAEAVVTLGARGCVAHVAGRSYYRAAVPVEVVDTTGAGHAFVAGYLAERLLDRAVEERLSVAATAGALACTAAGDWESLPYRRDLAAARAPEPAVL